MPRFFREPPIHDPVIITGEDARHISLSLRMKVGESLTLCDGEGFDYDCEIEEIDSVRNRFAYDRLDLVGRRFADPAHTETEHAECFLIRAVRQFSVFHM